MKTGWDAAGRDWSAAYYQEGLNGLGKLEFVPKTFVPGPALVSRQPRDGYRNEIEYYGQEFDSDQYEVVEGRWNHHHCKVCYFEIKNGDSFWENENGSMLCDVCHQYVEEVHRHRVGGEASG